MGLSVSYHFAKILIFLSCFFFNLGVDVSNVKENHKAEVEILRVHAEKAKKPLYEITPVSETSDYFSYQIDPNSKELDEKKLAKNLAKVIF